MVSDNKIQNNEYFNPKRNKKFSLSHVFQLTTIEDGKIYYQTNRDLFFLL
jgi:hypothetical protein